MKISNRQNQYNVELSEGETIEIKINGVVVVNESVDIGKRALITYMYQELDAVS